jgi:serine/threonine-protein kinase
MGPPPCGETFGPYEILRELGKGAAGTVYVASDMRSGAEVAVKILADELSARDQRRARLRKQLDLVRTLDHPNVVRVLDDGEREGRPYVVMEIVNGRPLTELLRGDMDLEFAMEIFEKVCHGVEHAHSLGCFHRDLKPQNILITRDGDPRVTDFGITRAVERQPDLWCGAARARAGRRPTSSASA